MRHWASHIQLVLAVALLAYSPRAAAQQPVAIASIRSLLRQRAYAEAEAQAREYLASVDRNAPAPVVADALDVLVETLRLESRSHEAETRALAERALRVREALYGPMKPELLPSLVNLAALFKERGEYSAAKPIAEKVVQLRTRQLGPADLEVARDLTALGIIQLQLSEYPGAKHCFERAMAIREKRFGAEDAGVAESLTYLGVVYSYMGDDERALQLNERALAIHERVSGPDDPHEARTLNVLANLHFARGEYVAARRMHERALAIREKRFGPDNVIVAESLHNLAALLSEIGEYDAALPLCERALAIRVRSLGPEHELVGASLLNLGNLHRTFGEYARALPVYRRALAIREKTLGANHQWLSLDHMLLGGLLHQLGENQEARSHYDRALQIARSSPQARPRDIAKCLEELGQFLADTGYPLEARPLLEEALTIQERELGSDHHDVGVCRERLANDLAALGERRRARELYDQATQVLEKAFGPRHDAVAMCLVSFGDFLAVGEDRPAAERCYRRALSIRQGIYGSDHPQVGDIWHHLATLQLSQGDRRGALEAALEAERIGRKHLSLTCRTLPEERARGYASVRDSGLDLAISVAVADGGSAASQAWDARTRSRALLLDEMAARHRTTSETGDPKILKLNTDLVQARRRLANLSVRGVGSEGPERYHRLLEEARHDKEEIERALAEASSSFRREQTRATVGLTQVIDALPAGSALVAYSRYEQTAPGAPVRVSRSSSGSRPSLESEISYAAFVLPGKGRPPVLVPLGPASAIDTLVARWSIEIARGPKQHGGSAENTYRKVGAELRRAVWDPVRAHLQSTQRVFVVPDGSLQLLSLAVLPVDSKQYLLETGPVFHYLSAERDLVPIDEKPPPVAATTAPVAGMLVLGGPDFDAPNLFASLQHTALAAATHSSETNRRQASARTPGRPAYRGARPVCGNFEAVRFAPLPGAAREVDELARLWNRAQRLPGRLGVNAPCTQLTGSGANEAAFKQLAPGMENVHVATHGFFLGTDCSAALDGVRGIGSLRPDTGARPNPGLSSPLLLSGLALAGANRRSAAGPDEEDGILTAEEIASLDLRGVRWAVLSGCDTGLGEIEAGEGVFGLRRAFEVAGARTVIMSLWPIRDSVGRQWMHALYTYRLLDHLGTAEAVQRAGLEMLRKQREAGQSTHPLYWGGFVAAGDWR